MKLTALEMVRLAQAARHMAGDSDVPLSERAAALGAAYRLEAALKAMEVEVEVEV